MRRIYVFVLGAVFGAALLWGSAFAGLTLGFSGAGGGAFSVLLLFAIVVAAVALGGFLARLLLYGGPSWRSPRLGLFIGGSFFAGAFLSGAFLGVMILLDATASQRTLFLFVAGPGLGLMYGMVLGMPAVVGAALAETSFHAQRGGGATG